MNCAFSQKFTLTFVWPQISKCVLYNLMCDCHFFTGGKPPENVEQYTHLGRIISSTSLDTQDVTYRRNCFIGQTNNFLRFFNHLDLTVKLKLFKSYCSSMYGCELWALSDDCIQVLNTVSRFKVWWSSRSTYNATIIMFWSNLWSIKFKKGVWISTPIRAFQLVVNLILITILIYKT
jgi:hypothetical protein